MMDVDRDYAPTHLYFSNDCGGKVSGYERFAGANYSLQIRQLIHDRAYLSPGVAK